MANRQDKVAIGALLHDIGKALLSAADGMNHSRSGYNFLKEEVGITDKEILDQVLYHHTELLMEADIPNNSLAYITYMADNIAAAADRRIKDAEDSKSDRNAALESVFNILNGNHGNMHYRQEMLEDDGTIFIPTAEIIQHNEHFYVEIHERLKELLSVLTDADKIQKSYINSLLAAMETNLSFTPSSTEKGQPCDVSLYDHVKITAALAGCINAWIEEQESIDYKELLFDKESEFHDKKVFLLYSIDISGIQDFIFHQFGTEDVLKSLRARSFYLEILLENLIDELLDCFQMSRANLIYSGGGHAWLLLPNTENAADKICAFEKKTNIWLLDTFGTELYMASGGVPCSSSMLENKPAGSYRELFRCVSRKVSKNKLHRYTADQILALNGIGEQGNAVPGTVQIKAKGRDRTRECRICHRSDRLKGDDVCTICDGLSRLSKAVLTSEFFAVSSETGDGRLPVFEEQYLVPVEKETLRKMIAEDGHYIRSFSKNKIYTSQPYATKLWVADYSSAQTIGELIDESNGIRRLGVIRADVDNLGLAFISGFPEEYQTLSRSASFSRMLSLFFKKNVNDILKNPRYYLGENGKKRNATVIYAGGDDLFIIGAWKDIIEFSVDLQEKLAAFSEDTLKISAGIGLYNEKYPISYIAAKSGDLEQQSKHLDGKNAVTLFTTVDKGENHTYHWKEFVDEVLGVKLSLLRRFFGYKAKGEELARGKVFLYHILELYRHSEDKINLARLAYLLARLEPSPSAEDEYKVLYNELKNKLYTWHRSENDRKQFITAIYIYAYMIRDREG